MTKMLRAYLLRVRAALADDSTDCDALQRDLLAHLAFFQHERLVHLIITLAFAVMLIASFLLPLELAYIIIRLALLALTAAYVAHYYFLENSVQELYRLYDALRDRSETE